MKMFERIVIPTILDPIPRSFRACLGHIVLNQREIDACRRNSEDDRDTIEEIMDIVQAEDMADANRTFIFKPRKVNSKTPKIGPSVRLSMLNVIYRKTP
jgi:hypothetical protein